MASLQQIVRNLNSKPTTMSLNERFAMLSSARAQQPQQQQPQRIEARSAPQSARGGWMSPPQMSFSNNDNGALVFANRMAAAKQRGSPIGVIGGDGVRGARGRRGGRQQQRSPLKQQMRSPQLIQQQRAAQAILRKATAQNRRLAQQLLARPTAVRLAQKLKKRSVMQRLGAKAGQPNTGRTSLASLTAKIGQRRNLGGFGGPNRRSPMKSPLRAKSLLAGRLGAKRLSLNQRLGPKQGSPQKKQNQQQNQQLNKQLNKNRNQVGQQKGTGNQQNKNRGGSANRNVRYFTNSSLQQNQQQQQRQNFNNRRRRGGRGGNSNNQNRGQPSKQSLDADMDSYWNK